MPTYNAQVSKEELKKENEELRKLFVNEFIEFKKEFNEMKAGEAYWKNEAKQLQKEINESKKE